MNDKMILGDGLAVRLACGHPNKKAGQLCELCNEVVPDTAGATEASPGGVQSTAEQEKPA